MFDPLDKIKDLMDSGKEFPNNVRLFIVRTDRSLYLHDGRTEFHWHAESVMSNLRQERGSVLDGFAIFEFLITEFLRFTILGLEKNEKLIQIIRTHGIKRRISYLESWKCITKDLSKDLQRLFLVRDGMAHKFSPNEVTYREKPIFENFSIFLKDMQNTWNSIVAAYNAKLLEFDFSELLQEDEDIKK